MVRAMALAFVTLFLALGGVGCVMAYRAGVNSGRETARKALDGVYQAITERADNQMEPPTWGQIQAIVGEFRRHYERMQ
jgi:hypothetical protein